MKLWQKAHDFAIRFSLWIKIAAAFRATHGQASQRIFQNLFKTKKFHDARIYGRMKPQSAFIRPDCAVELNAVSSVDLCATRVVNPGNPECDLPLRLDKPFERFLRAPHSG